MTEADISTTSIDSDSGTTGDTSSDSGDSGESTVASESTEERTANAVSSGEADSIDLDSVPKELRPHVEKYAKKYEKDFKSAYTKKFQELGSKEQLWKQQQQSWEQEKEQLKQVAMEILSDTENKKLEAYRQLYGFGAKAAKPAIPDTVKTVGDLVEWNRQEMAQEKEQIKAEAQRAAVEAVERTTSVQRWKVALIRLGRTNTSISTSAL